MSKNFKTVIAKKPYCKVCHDAGKSESEYTNHWVKDLTGKTTCPTLLNTQCRYCFKLGHTAKFCDVLAKKNKEKERAPQEKPIDKNTNKKPQNGFASLCYDSDSEEEHEVSDDDDDEFPSLCTQQSKNFEPVKTGWATIVAAKANPIKQVIVVKPIVKPVAKPAPWVTANQPERINKWAYYSDSEDDFETYSLPEDDCYDLCSDFL